MAIHFLLAAALLLAGAWPCSALSPDMQSPSDPQTASYEEPENRISAVNLEGFGDIPSSEVRSVMETQPAALLDLGRDDPILDPLKLKRDQKRLEQLCQQYGYYSARVDYKVTDSAVGSAKTVTFTAKPGPQTTVESVELSFPDDAIRQVWETRLRPLVSLKPGDPFLLSAYQAGKEALIRQMGMEAHPQGTVEGRVLVRLGKNQAGITFKIDPGRRFLFGRTTVKGNSDIKEKFILGEKTYLAGQPYSTKDLLATQRKLLATGFFNSATITPDFDQVENQMVPLVLEVVERDAHSIQLGLGWGNEDRFRVRLNQVNRNMLGLNEMLTFEGKYSDIYQGLVGTLRVPHFPIRDWIGQIRGGLEQLDEEAYLDRRRFLTPTLEHSLAQGWTMYFGYNWEVNNMVDIKAQVPDPEFEKQELVISSIPLGFSFDNRDSPLNPTRGTFMSAEVEMALGALGSEVQFVRPVATLSHILPLPWMENLYLAARAKAGFAIPLLDDERIPLVRRFFPGGADSVRGYPYQKLGPLDSQGKPLGGEAMLEGGVELRFPIWGDLGGVLFVDAGNAFESISQDMATLRYTTGAGLRYNTPVGPLRLDVGYQLNPEDESELDEWAYYLTVGQAF